MFDDKYTYINDLVSKYQNNKENYDKCPEEYCQNINNVNKTTNFSK